jgi:hypothetical protein
MKSDRAFCSVVAKNYLASARTLAGSLRQLHPDIPTYVLFLDDFRKALNPEAEPFQPMALDEIGLGDLAQLCFRYDVVELATVVKPQLLRHLFERYQLSKLMFLDPDTMAVNSLDGLFETLDHVNLILTPHVDTDYPDDGRKPDTATLLTYGLYNLGCIALKESAETLRFLDWWQAKIGKRCTRDFSSVYFLDQRVMDLVPLLFQGVHVEREPGYNAGYWSIHSRRIELHDSSWWCNGQPLRFFHFSGFDPAKPQLLSRDTTRAVEERGDDLLKLLAVYREQLLRNGYESTSLLPYDHDRLSNGDRVLYGTRRAYRNSERWQKQDANPFHSRRAMIRNRLERVKLMRARRLIPRLLRMLRRLDFRSVPR